MTRRMFKCHAGVLIVILTTIAGLNLPASPQRHGINRPLVVKRYLFGPVVHTQIGLHLFTLLRIIGLHDPCKSIKWLRLV
jgi:hypothetical protein